MTTATGVSTDGWTGLGRTLTADRSRWLWLALGAAISLLAVGQRWDVGLAAWIAPIFLLRFSRTSRPLMGIGSMVAVCAAQVAWLVTVTGTALDGMRIAMSFALGAIFAAPFILDRLLAPRLGRTGRMLLLPVAA